MMEVSDRERALITAKRRMMGSMRRTRALLKG